MSCGVRDHQSGLLKIVFDSARLDLGNVLRHSGLFGGLSEKSRENSSECWAGKTMAITNLRSLLGGFLRYHSQK